MKKLLIIVFISLDIFCVEENYYLLNDFQKKLLLIIIEKTHNENLYNFMKKNYSNLLTDKKFITFFHEISHSIVKFIGIENKLICLFSKEEQEKDIIQILNNCIGESYQQYFFLENTNQSYQYFYNCLFYAIGITAESLLYVNNEKEKPVQEYINLETFYELAKTGDINMFYENYNLLATRISSDYNSFLLDEKNKKIFLENNITIFIKLIEKILIYLEQNIQIIITQFNAQNNDNNNKNEFIIQKNLFLLLPIINDSEIEITISDLRLESCFSISDSNKNSVNKSSIGENNNDNCEIYSKNTPLKNITNTENSVEKTNTSNKNFLKELLGDDNFYKIYCNKNKNNNKISNPNKTTDKKKKYFQKENNNLIKKKLKLL